MEWIRRNPKKAAGLSALALACAVILVWGVTNGSGKADPTLGVTAPLATPTQAPPRSLTGPLAPSAAPTSVDQVVGGLPSTGMGGISGVAGTGFNSGLKPHHIVITAESDGPLAGVGWKMPTADGPRGGKDAVGARSFRHEATVYGPPDYAQLYTFDGPESSRLSCTITVDGKVTDHQEAHGPWGQVFCQG
jgi:hypothetical protein